MKILFIHGDYISGVQLVELDNKTIEKRSTYIKDGKPSFSVIRSWDSFEEYNKERESGKIDLDKVFKNW